MDPTGKEKQTAKAPSKLLLRNRDSGYISTSPATSSTEGTVIRRSLSGAKDRVTPPNKSPEEAVSPEFIGSVTPSFAVGEMQRTLAQDSSSSSQGAYQEEPTSPESNQFAHLTHHTSTPPTNLNTNDRVLLAFKCRGAGMDWDRCIHPYCHTVRRQWERFQRCCQDILNHCCPDCSKFKNMILSHSHNCNNQACPVVMCNETRNLCQAQKEQLAGNARRTSSIIRSQSFSERTPVSEYQGLPFWLSSSHIPAYNNANELSTRGLMGDSPVSMEMIEAKAAEIVERLDQEEPLLKSSAERPCSLPSQDERGQGLPGSALSPIVEIPGREDMTSLSPSEPPYSFGDNNVSLILRSHTQYNSYTAFSSYGDGPGSLGGHPSLGQPSQPSHSMSSQPSSMVVVEQPEVPERVYPKQENVHRLDNINVIPGQDGYYHQHRDYYLNDIDCLGSGGFGTCMFGQDNTTSFQFAMKRNKEAMDSLRAECFVLSRLGMHDHVIRFLGAVIDEEDNVLQPRVFKMFMELADCGNLAELLIVDNESGAKEPLPLDQSLYYIQQVLQGVNYLHQNGVLHLDIKAVNVLVFDQGRTVKLADFGTAVQLSEIAAVGGKLTGCTPYFASPEVVRQEQPGFSADIWGVMCVLVELLTTRWPGCHRDDIPISHHSMMFLVGQYKDSDIEKLIPLSQMNLDPSIEQLFRWVFVADPTRRPSALTLLNQPRIMEAPKYAQEFDCEDYDEEMSQEVSEIQQTTPIPGHPSSQYTQAANGTLYASSQVGAAAEQPPLLHSSQNYASMELEKDYPSMKRESHDSGTGEELDLSLTSRGFPLRSSTGGSSDRPVYRTLDSGLDTPAPTDSWRSKFINWPSDDNPFPVQGIDNYEDYHSFPFTDSTHNETPFKRSSSITGTTYNSKHSDSNNPIPGSQPRKLVPSNHRLYHSYSAPIVGDQFARRRLSLQMSRDKNEGEERPRLRRTSSMVYVDKGPDIDSPEREKRPSIEELISDVSGLKLDHTHSRQPERTEHVQEYVPVSSTVTRQLPGRMLCARGPNVREATPTSQKPVTVYETIC